MSGISVKFVFEKTKDDAHNNKSTFGYICLVYIPVGIALSNILMRKMKGLHFIQLSLYKIVIALIIASSICAIKQESLSILT